MLPDRAIAHTMQGMPFPHRKALYGVLRGCCATRGTVTAQFRVTFHRKTPTVTTLYNTRIIDARCPCVRPARTSLRIMRGTRGDLRCEKNKDYRGWVVLVGDLATSPWRYLLQNNSKRQKVVVALGNAIRREQRRGSEDSRPICKLTAFNVEVDAEPNSWDRASASDH